ncbi:MAG: DUF4270 domain-containing protein [Flavobacteriales bacterium]
MLKTFWGKLTLLTLASMVIFSCVKETNTIGDDLIGGQDTETIFTDTIQVTTSVKVIDSVNSANKNFVMIGAINDPKFGKTESNLFSQVLLEKNNIDFGAGANLDSIVLILPYSGYYGDTTSSQTFNIHEVTEVIDTFKQFSHQNYAYDASPIGTSTFVPHVKSGDSYNSLRIKLDDSFGEKIFSKSGQAELKDDESFKDFIKGLAIIPENNHNSEEGALFIVEFQNIKMRLFYNTPTSSDSINFVFTSSSEHLNEYKHNYAGTPAGATIGTEDNELLFLQGLSGIETVVDFPTIHSLQESLGGSSVTINKAFLQIYRTTDTLENFRPSLSLLINEFRKPTSGTSEDLNYYPILDDASNGVYDQEENVYRFNITRYLSDRMLNDNSNEKLYIRNQSYTSLFRTVMKGVDPVNGNKKMTLNVVYTKNKE